ncbi:WAT1-related protein [Trifolium repens]|nr:WAT1-related protein [Trifolium repens]
MKFAIDSGISNYVFVVYRNGIASVVLAPVALYVDRNVRPAMTFRRFGTILFLSFLGITLDQNLYFAGMELTTPTFAAAMSNTIPSITFILAVIFGMENINITTRSSQAKVMGTMITLAGATIMTLIKGPALYGNLRANSHHRHGGGDYVRGTVWILLGCLSSAGSTVFSRYASDTYPQLSLTLLVCVCGTVEGIFVALLMEDQFHSTAWSYFKWDTILLTAVYAGIACSGVSFYLRLKVVKARGPTFATAFSPICMVMVTVASIIIFGDLLTLGSVIGSVIISFGLLCLLWGSRPAEEAR